MTVMLGSIQLFNLCIVHFLHWFGVHLVGNNLPILKYLNDSVSIVPGAPTSGDVRIEKIKMAMLFFHIIFVVVMSVKYCFQILLLIEKFDDRRTSDTALCPGERCDMHENEQLLFGREFLQLAFCPVGIRTDIISLIIGRIQNNDPNISM